MKLKKVIWGVSQSLDASMTLGGSYVLGQSNAGSTTLRTKTQGPGSAVTMGIAGNSSSKVLKEMKASVRYGGQAPLEGNTSNIVSFVKEVYKDECAQGHAGTNRSLAAHALPNTTFVRQQRSRSVERGLITGNPRSKKKDPFARSPPGRHRAKKAASAQMPSANFADSRRVGGESAAQIRGFPSPARPGRQTSQVAPADEPPCGFQPGNHLAPIFPPPGRNRFPEEKMHHVVAQRQRSKQWGES